MLGLEKDIATIFSEVGTEGLILGSDCTLPTGIPYENIASVAEISKKLSVPVFNRSIANA